MGRPSKEEKKKQEEAKAKVDELLGDIDINLSLNGKQNVKLAEKLNEVASQAGGNKWLKDELTKATNNIKELTDEVIKYKTDYEKLLKQKSAEPVAEGEQSQDAVKLKNQIRGIFTELDNNYQGRNQQRTPYRDIKIHAMLEKFMRAFPFLVEEGKKKRQMVKHH